MDLAQSSLLDELRIVGHWWLPENPQERLAGTLTYDPEAGVRLEINGVFSSSDLVAGSFWSTARSVRFEIVLGEDTDGQPFTLHEADLLSLASTSIFRVSYLLGGIHFSKTEEITFVSALAQYTHLEEWSCYQFTRSTASTSPDYFCLEIPTNRCGVAQGA